jgi:hypothetical protein
MKNSRVRPYPSTNNMLKEIQAIVYFGLTSSFRGFGGGGKVDLSSFRPLALSAPLDDLGFFPISVSMKDGC